MLRTSGCVPTKSPADGKNMSVDWPPLFVGPAKGVYKAKVLAESKSRLGERLLEAALLDRCGGKCDTWVGNKQLAADTRLAHEYNSQATRPSGVPCQVEVSR